MGLFDSIRKFFGGTPAGPAAVEVSPPNLEPVVVPFPSNPSMEEAIAQGSSGAWQVYADWLIEQGVSWGEVIAAALQGNPNLDRQEALARQLLGTEPRKVVWDRGVIDQLTFIPQGENKPPMHLVLENVLKHPAGHFVRELTLGLPPDLDLNWHLEDLARTIAKTSPLPCLRKLDMSVTSPAMDQISWRRVGDIACIWKALPQLEELLLQGSVGQNDGIPSKLAPIEATSLKRFVFVSGGLDQSVPLELGAASLPSLEHLELWLGEPNYGCTVTVQSLEGILSGARLPKLTSLAIKNSGEEGSLIEAVAKSALLPRLQKLDFSMGVLAEGATAAFQLYVEKFKHLKSLDLRDNYFSAADQATLRAALPMIEFGEQKPHTEPDDRYVSVSE